MIIHNVKQNTDEWLALRAGVPTASEFHKILTPGGKLSKQAEGYMYHLLAEKIVGHAIQSDSNQWMDRGHDLESEAVKSYEFVRDVETEKVGFITDDSCTVGCSPDRLVGEDRILEIKVPKHTTHVGYMIHGKVEDDYYPQLQGQLWLTGRTSVDIVSYNPEIRSVVLTVARDEKYISLLAAAIESFVEEMDRQFARLLELYGPFERKVAEPVGGSFGVTDEDLELIYGKVSV